ncbi:MAG: inner membrane-spanning protein YciB [Pseudomonadota bacterium]
MAERPVNPVLKQILDFGPPIAFFLIYRRIKDETYVVGGVEYEGFIAASVLFIPILLMAMGTLAILSRKISRIHIFTLFMVLLFGGLTVWFNDERFFKMKTSLVYGTIALLLIIGLVQGKSYVKSLLGDYLDMQDEGWIKFAQGIAAINILLAAINEFVWRTMTTETWVTIETFAIPGLSVVLTIALIFSLQKYVIELPNEAEDDQSSV